MKKSLDSGKVETIEGGFTVADGISVRTPGEQTFEIIKDKIDEIVLVDDNEIINAMFLLMERSKSVVEPAGAAGLAYLISKKPSPGKKVVPILCGGNIDMYLLGQIVAKGLALSLETEDQKHMDKLIQHLKEKNIDFKVLT
jgi:threonine dehydratase